MFTTCLYVRLFARPFARYQTCKNNKPSGSGAFLV